MKHIILVALLTFLSMTSAHAGGLFGTDAANMVKFLRDAGVQPSPSGTLIQGFDEICTGDDFLDVCIVATQSSDPALHRKQIQPGVASTEFWSLLKKMGLVPFQSQLADGTAGMMILEGGSITCSIHSTNSSNDECSVSAH